MMLSRHAARLLIAFLLCLPALADWSAGRAQNASPPAPTEYQAVIRYRIRASAEVRVPQFREMIRYLESIGFHKAPGPEDEEEDADQVRLAGTISAANAHKILRERHVRSVLLIPAGFTVPAEADVAVKVQLLLPTTLELERQQVLARQVAAGLAAQGFREAIGYDNRGHTRLVGYFPAGKLELLLEDLRWQGTGWLAPAEPVADLPQPLRSGWPVSMVEVIPEPAGVPPAKGFAAGPATDDESLLKISRDLRALLKQQEPMRLELVLAAPPQTTDDVWRRDLARTAPGSMLEGQMGAVITLRAPPAQAAELAKLPSVLTVRLPRPARAQVLPLSGPVADNAGTLRASGLERLHALGHRGKGVRIAVVGDDFRGHERFVGKQLPACTRYLDLTGETTATVQPEPFSGAAPALASGTQGALVAALAAPEAELTLIRISPDSPYQLEAVSRWIDGEIPNTFALEQRAREIEAENTRLEGRADELLVERRQVRDNFGEDKASVERREAYYKNQAELEEQQKVLRLRRRRYLNLLHDLISLKGIQLVANTLAWNEGYPVDGSGALSRYFDSRQLGLARWFQAAGDATGQAWAGFFQDRDGNGILEFAAAGQLMKPGRWTHELNFLGWQPLGAANNPELPKSRLRISVQWQEPHDPRLAGLKEDVYRVPLAQVELLLLRQRDPSGSKLRLDDMELAAQSTGVPLRLFERPGSASYEQTVEYEVAAPGRYALMVRGQVPRSIRPASEPTVPGEERTWELRPRLFLSVLDEASRLKGKAVFLDYATDQGTPGMPADAHQILATGAARLSGKPELYSSPGPAFGQALHGKPDLLAFDRFQFGAESELACSGTGLAACFAAGLEAAILSSRPPIQPKPPWMPTYPSAK
jgi:hypothetical protein